MGLLGRLFSRDKPDQEKEKESRFADIGNVDAICPYCDTPLEKKPGGKKKCPHCGKYIYVLPRPSDDEQVLLTLGQWKIVKEIRHAPEEYRQAFEAKYTEEETALKKQAGAEPAIADVLWRMLNKRLVHCGNEGCWIQYYNTRFEMADLLEREGRTKNALPIYLEVGYLSVNGPQDQLFESDLYPPFNPKLARPGPRAVRGIQSTAEKLELDLAEVKARFLQATERAHQQLQAPLTPEQAWGKIEGELQLE